MSTTDSDPEDAITKEEIAGTAPAPSPRDIDPSRESKARNAFTELMSPKPKPPPAPPMGAQSKMAAVTRPFKDRDGLGAYTSKPETWPTSRVISYTSDFVIINDLYPKSTVHTLLLPRSPLSRLHPFEAFENPDFLNSVQTEALKLKKLVAKELQRCYGKHSAQDKLREQVLNEEIPWTEPQLPTGRDWEKEVLVGIHAHPSMNDLHVHVLSRDMYSECLRHRKHYNSFNTPFLIDVADFPLAADDPRLHPGRAGYMDSDLRCWRCGWNFGNKFKALKAHLAEEFEAWKKE